MLPRTAWIEVDLDALRRNFATIRRIAGPRVPVHPVVKAEAYGHGAAAVARALEAAGADGFCVATLDEALALRDTGIRRPILVLYPIPPAWVPEATRRRIAVTAGDLDQLAALLDAAPAGRTRLRIQLEVETGLGRGGLLPEMAGSAATLVAARGRARLDGLWTHFQAPDDAPATSRQLERFELAAAAVAATGVRLPPRHVTASGSIVQGDVAAYDGIRPGLALYGLVPDELLGREAPDARALAPVLSLVARPVRVMDLPTGAGISYGPTFRTTRPSRIATLPLGYGDGWSRALSNRAHALVRGMTVPLVGSVAMDAVMADVTDMPGDPVTTADEFVLIGRQGGATVSAAELARLRTTNTWEVVTNLSGRLPRVYDAASGLEGVRTLVSGGGRG